MTRLGTPRRHEGTPPNKLLISAVCVLMLVAAFVAIGYRSVTSVPGLAYRTLYADIPDIASLRAHDEVRVAGVRVGQVLNPRVRNGRALVEIQLQPGVGRLPADTQVFVRGRGLLGSRFLELRPGRSSRMLDDGAVLKAKPITSLTYGVSDVLDTFDRDTRGGLGNVVRELGGGVAGRGAGLNDVLRRGPDITDQLTSVTKAILARGSAARDLFPSAASGTTALARARDDIAGMFDPASRGLAPFTRARTATQQTLDEAPATVAAVRDELGLGTALLRAVRGLTTTLNPALVRAPEGLRQTTALLREGPRALRRTSPLLASVKRAVPAVLRVTKTLSPVLTPLRDGLDDLTPIVDSLAVHGCDVANFADNWRSVLGYGAPSKRALPGGDAGNFNQLRVQLLGGPQTVGSVLPGVGNGFSHRRDILGPPCQSSPGREYPQLSEIPIGRTAR